MKFVSLSVPRRAYFDDETIIFLLFVYQSSRFSVLSEIMSFGLAVPPTSRILPGNLKCCSMATRYLTEKTSNL